MNAKQRIGQYVFDRLPITRFLFDQLRSEANAGLVTLVNEISPSHRRLLQEIRQRRDVHVNVGCGPQVIPGFLNLDLFAAAPSVVRWDCRRGLPLSDEAAGGIRAEHFVEHLETREELPSFLRDCWRCLRPGGILRVIVPDAERYVRAYCAQGSEGFRSLSVPEPFPQDLPTRMDIVNHVFHQWHEHRWGYDFETLAHRLEAAGFSDITRVSFAESLDMLLASDRPEHASYSLYVDSRKLRAR